MAWGCDSTEPSAPTTVSLSPAPLTFDAIGAKDTIVATVLDQRGDPMRNVPLTWSVEGSAVIVTPLGGESAVVLSTANGSAIVRALVAAEIDGEAAATVTQAPAQIFSIAGNNQLQTVATTLGTPIRVAVRDRNGHGVTGIRVEFNVTRGDGSLSPAEAVTGEFGEAAVSWTLGTSTSTGQEVTAVAEGVEGFATISATALPATETTLTILRGDNQTAAISSLVFVPPAVRVTDQYGNGVPSIFVSYQIIDGGGAIHSGNGQTNSAGEHGVQGWELGFQPGPNTLRASIPNRGLSVDFHATAIAPPTISVNAGAEQAAMVNTTLPVRPSFVVRDGSRNPIPGVAVVFSVLEGGGTLTNETAVTDADGIASPGDWILGPVANRNRMTARGLAPLLESVTVTLDAYGCEGGGGVGYEITLCITSAITTLQRQGFEAAAARWKSAITGDLPAVNANFTAPCPGSPRLQMTVDDLLIFVSIRNIDGRGGVLGQAAPCRIRGTGSLPYVGLMQFDASDVQDMLNNGSFQSVVLHEMAHVIGVGPLWNELGLLVNPSSSTVPQDTYFSGSAARAAFDAVGGIGYTGGQKVPVENEGGDGTRNSHWREAVFRNELMTGFINVGNNPLSIVTIRSLEDLGYAVNTAAAEGYVYTPTAGLRSSEAIGESLPLIDDILDIPLWRTENGGSEVRVK